MIIFISTLIIFLFTTFVVDGFKYSDTKWIKLTQKYTFIILIIVLLFYLSINLLFDPAYCSTSAGSDDISSTSTIQSGNRLSVEGSGKDWKATVDVGQGTAVEVLNNAASTAITEATGTLGLSGVMGVTATAVSKTIKSSSLPPLQKVGTIVGSAAAIGLIHTGLRTINNINTTASSSRSTKSSITNQLNSSEENLNRFNMWSPLEHQEIDTTRENILELIRTILSLEIVIGLLFIYLIISSISLIFGPNIIQKCNNIISDRKLHESKTIFNKIKLSSLGLIKLILEGNLKAGYFVFSVSIFIICISLIANTYFIWFLYKFI